MQADPPPTLVHPEEGGRNIWGPTEGFPEASGSGREEKRVDLGGHMDTRQRESLCATRSREVPVPYLEVGTRYHGKLEWR